MSSSILFQARVRPLWLPGKPAASAAVSNSIHCTSTSRYGAGRTPPAKTLFCSKPASHSMRSLNGVLLPHRRQPMANDSQTRGEGFGRPPKRTQCKKGTSGNPRGRPKKVSNFKTDLAAELQEKLVLTESG